MSSKNKSFKTSIGGQAVIEGVMMRGPNVSALAVRKPDKEIYLETWDTDKGEKTWYKKTYFVRGCFNFIDMLLVGYKTLMKSSEIAGETFEEEGKFEKWLMEKLGDKFTTVFSFTAMFLALVISVGLFVVLPTLITSLVKNYITNSMLLSLFEGTLKIAILIAYMALVSRSKDIKRVFMYHGAEHKTIACYESGEELTVENASKHSRFHPRCGTSFLLIVVLVSILVSSAATWDNTLMRILIKIALLPLIVGISYEIIRFVGKHDNAFTRILSAPGLWLQKLTTCEPEAEQLEVAIASILPCLPKVKGADLW